MRDILPSGLNICLELSGQIRFRLQEALDHGAHALQRRERHHDDALGSHGAVEHFGVAIGRRLLVAPDDMFAGAFKRRSPLLVGLQAQQALSPGHMFDDRAFERPRQPSAANCGDNQVRGNHAGARQLHGSQQLGLDNIAGGLTIGANGPTLDGGVKPTTGPPLGVEAGQVAGEFVGSRFRFADPVRGHKEPFFKDFTL